jgi:hypothetical protein
MIRNNLIKSLVICFALSSANYSFSQKTASTKKNVAWEENFYLAFNTTSYLDIIKTPLRMVDIVVGTDLDPNDPNKVIPRYAKVPYQSATINLFSIGLEPRYNFHVLNDDAAFAVSIPTAIGIGATSSVDETVLGTTGFGSIQVPLMLKFYLGNGSTYKSEKDYGISIGGGVEYDKLGLLNVAGESEIVKNKGFVLPVASFGIHFWRNNSPVEINLKYGQGSIEEYDSDKYGASLRDQFGNLVSRNARSSSFRISFVTLLNY